MVYGLWSMVSLWAGERPSLFRGVVVADSPLGVRVVSVEDASQASLADLRPDDLILRVRGQEVRSIDEFAALSSGLKGRATEASLLIFRHGAPQELRLHLYSYPLLREWGLEFVPDDDIRFAQPEVGLAYWLRLGRGFEEAGKPEEALQAYLNGLHQVPTDAGAALKASALLFRLCQRRVRQRALTEGIASLREAVVVMERLFDYPLTHEQLQVVRRDLQETLGALREAAEISRSETAQHGNAAGSK